MAVWQIDPVHSHIEFKVRHMMISRVRGRFEKFGGTVDFDPDNPERTGVDIEIEAASINTDAADRDAHLRSPDFLYAEEFPVLRYKSKRVEVIDDNHARLIGDLTIRDVTREVPLDVEYSGLAKSPWGSTSAGFTASTTINRKDFNLTWNQTLETGGVLVGDDIEVNIELELIKQEQEEQEAETSA